MSTIHAGSIGELLHRIESEPMNIPRVLFQALDTVAFPAQVVVKNARVRRVINVTEILGIDPGTNELLTNDVFRWDAAQDSFTYLGRSFVLENDAQRSGRTVEALTEELRRKEHYLTLMDNLRMSYYKEVSEAIAAYYIDPAEATSRLEKRSHG
jgi:flagellar protein FlaI